MSVSFSITLKKKIKGFSKKTKYPVLLIETEVSQQIIEPKEPSPEEKTDSDWSEEDQAKQEKKIHVENQSVIFFLIGNEKTGAFRWIDASKTMFAGIQSGLSSK